MKNTIYDLNKHLMQGDSCGHDIALKPPATWMIWYRITLFLHLSCFMGISYFFRNQMTVSSLKIALGFAQIYSTTIFTNNITEIVDMMLLPSLSSRILDGTLLVKLFKWRLCVWYTNLSMMWLPLTLQKCSQDSRIQIRENYAIIDLI